MAEYRVYFLDAGDHIIGSEEAAYDSDARALDYVDTILREHFGIEVWAGARRVGRFTGGRATQPQTEDAGRGRSAS